MRKELQDILYDKYPSLFRQKDLPMTQTAMCWGIDTDDGWFGILDEMCAKISDYEALKREELGDVHENIEFFQIKEKFGTLRIYTHYSDPVVDDIIQETCEKSATVCGACGADKAKTKILRGWYYTFCDPCREDYIEKMKQREAEIKGED